MGTHKNSLAHLANSQSKSHQPVNFRRIWGCYVILDEHQVRLSFVKRWCKELHKGNHLHSQLVLWVLQNPGTMLHVSEHHLLAPWLFSNYLHIYRYKSTPVTSFILSFWICSYPKLKATIRVVNTREGRLVLWSAKALDWESEVSVQLLGQPQLPVWSRARKNLACMSVPHL